MDPTPLLESMLTWLPASQHAMAIFILSIFVIIFPICSGTELNKWFNFKHPAMRALCMFSGLTILFGDLFMCYAVGLCEHYQVHVTSTEFKVLMFSLTAFYIAAMYVLITPLLNQAFDARKPLRKKTTISSTPDPK